MLPMAIVDLAQVADDREIDLLSGGLVAGIGQLAELEATVEHGR